MTGSVTQTGGRLLTSSDTVIATNRGGGIDPGEAMLPALAREVLEETGHACRLFRRIGAFRSFTWMADYGMYAEKLCHVFAGQAGGRLGAPTEAGHRAIWVRPQDAPARLESVGAAAFVTAWLAAGARDRTRKTGRRPSGG